MKKILLILGLIFVTGSFVQAENVVPDRIITDTINTYGIYQVNNEVIVYSEPDEKSAIKQKILCYTSEFNKSRFIHRLFGKE